MLYRVVKYILVVSILASVFGCSGGDAASAADKKKIDEINSKGVNPNPTGKGVEAP